jgi:hypothetical protein
MDNELRELERLYTRTPGDDALRRRFLAGRARAGFPGFARLVGAMRELDATYKEARAAYATAAGAAFRTFVAGLFTEVPTLEHASLGWELLRPDDEEWTVRCTAHGLEEPFASWGLAFARIFPSAWRTQGRVRLDRVARCFGSPTTGVRIDHDDEASDTSPATAVREIPFRDSDSLQTDSSHLSNFTYVGEDAVLPIDGGDVLAALAALEEAEKALAAARSAFHAAATPLWEQLGPALFLEEPRLERVAVHGFTDGYNDNWYEEHRQRVILDGEYLMSTGQGLAERGLPTHGLEAPSSQKLPDEERWELERQFEPFVSLLRETYGFCFVLVLRRGEELLHGPAWRDH